MFNIEPFTITTVYGGHKISFITKKLRRNLNTTSGDIRKPSFRNRRNFDSLIGPCASQKCQFATNWVLQDEGL